MTKTGWKILLAVLAAVFCLTPNAFADQTANMDLTGVGNNGAYAGIYIGPYQATINGVSTPVICDDFGDESYIPETWTAIATNVSNLAADSNLKWGDNQTLYNEGAYLATLLANPANSANASAIQYALWQLMDATPAGGTYNNAVENWLAGELGSSGFKSFEGSATTAGSVLYYISQAEMASNYDSSNWSNVLIYSFDQCTTTVSSPCSSTNPPQEFMVVTTPEPSTILMLLLGLGAIFLFWRRQKNLGAIAAA
jgi:hypothetical protein